MENKPDSYSGFFSHGETSLFINFEWFMYFEWRWEVTLLAQWLTRILNVFYLLMWQRTVNDQWDKFQSFLNIGPRYS